MVGLGRKTQRTSELLKIPDPIFLCRFFFVAFFGFPLLGYHHSPDLGSISPNKFSNQNGEYF